jgi:hypothetical protein
MIPSLLLAALFGSRIGRCGAFSASQNTASREWASQREPVGNVLILDHLNINHEKGRHDWLRGFYFDFLRCAVDPRKQENLDAGRSSVWANVGAFQFHLPEGKPDAQVLEGIVTLVYPDLRPLRDRFRHDGIQETLRGSKFAMETESDGELVVTDPWGTKFRLVEGNESDRDTRGRQPGAASAGLAMRDLTIYTPESCNLAGIARFYESVFMTPVIESTSNRCVVSVGPKQTLTFQVHPERRSSVIHDDLRDDKVVTPPGCSKFLSNYGPHVSLYVADLVSCYRNADALGVVYVNPRFKRRAYTLEEAIDDCMFRCLDIVDPWQPGTVILSLEHEVRSVLKRDGTMYKSCPFDTIPDACAKQL